MHETYCEPLTRTTFLSTLSLLSLLTACVTSEPETRPNIILILADDQGYSTIRAYGGNPDYVATPNLDQLANEGARFTNAYVTSSTCSPSRAGILTGRYQQRFGHYANIDWYLGLPAEAKVFPTYLKEAGYRTAAIGKWHLGVDLEGQHPLDRGFDVYYGFNHAQTDYFHSPILFRGKKRVTSHDYLTRQFTQEAIDFVKRESEQPFFLYLAYNAVHSPNQVPQEYLQQFSYIPSARLRRQAAMLNSLDEGVGKLMNALRETKKDKSTMIIYLSDNGGLPAWWDGSNGRLRGYKREQWEGGNRVIFMVRWPGVVNGAQVRNEVIHSLDIAPTVLEVAGVKQPLQDPFDGLSLLPLLNQEDQTEIHDAIYWAGSHVERSDRFMKLENLSYPHNDAPPAFAVRRGPWKLIYILEKGEPMLFNLKEDIGELNDLKEMYPELVVEMKASFVQWFKEMSEPVAWNRKYFEQLKGI